MSKSEKSSKKRKSRGRMNSKDNTIYKALKNPDHTTSIIDENGIKRWLKPYKFISTLNKSIKYHKRHLSAEEADVMIHSYEMPAVQRCLQAVLMLNLNKDFEEADLHEYVAKEFKHITLEMLNKDYQTEEASKFKEDHEKSLNAGR